MKKALLLSCAVGLSCAFAGCNAYPIAHNEALYISSFPGLFYNNVKRPTFINDKLTFKCTYVKDVKKTIEFTNFLGCVWGGLTLPELKEEMLKGTNADDVINMSCSYKRKNILGFWGELEVTYSGKAVKYKR